MSVIWLPIDTAPKDRQIMAWNGVTGPYRTQYDRDTIHEGKRWPLYNWSGIGGVWYPQPTLWAELSCFAPATAAGPRPIAGGINPPADGGPVDQLIRTLETELANLKWSLTSERKLGWDTRFREGQVASADYAVESARKCLAAIRPPTIDTMSVIPIEQPHSISGDIWFFQTFISHSGATGGQHIHKSEVERRLAAKAGPGRLMQVDGVWHWGTIASQPIIIPTP